MLTKPRIISLLLVTTIAPMFVAGSPDFVLVLLVFVGGLPLADVAEVLAVPLGTVKSRLHHARAALAAALTAQEVPE